MEKEEGKATILLVEDDPDFCEILSVLLRMEGFQVVCARNGYEGYLAARRSRPDLIITDLCMPQVSGLELISRLKQTPRLAGVPVVALSAEEKSELFQARRLGAEAVLEKPLDFERVFAVVAQVLGARQRHRQGILHREKIA